MSKPDDAAAAALRGDVNVLAELAASLVRLESDNLVERPWGGSWIRRFKRIPEEVAGGALPWGEAFEIAAFNDDREAALFPSRLRFADGSMLELPALLEAHAETLLGADFVDRHGPCFPLLPKTLSVRELLSVQGHPAGHTEVYIIVDAEPGATLRLGFRRDIDAAEMTGKLTRGLEQQSELLALIGGEVDGDSLQAVVAPWFADRSADAAGLRQWLAARAEATAVGRAVELLAALKALYWEMLDSMNAIEVEPGQVIYNATPGRLIPPGGVASAEVHALGNPEGREILALEIRRPGPTFRAWDNVRFPQREVDVAAAVEALNLRATRPEEFVRERAPLPDRPGSFVSVDCEFFRVEHLHPDAGAAVAVPAGAPHSLHCLAGAVALIAADGRPLGSLRQGESGLVPVGVGAYRIESEARADVVRVSLPED